MSYTITQFGNDPAPDLPNLDQNFQAFGVITPIPGIVSGTNALTFTQNDASSATSEPLLAYENGVNICFIATATNTAATTARLGALPALNVYKDLLVGPVPLTGGEIVAGNAVTLRYDSTLNAGAGGWHIVSGIDRIANGTITPALVMASVGLQVGATTTPTLTGLLSANATLAYTAVVPNSTQDQSFTVTGLSITDALLMGFPLPVSTGLQLSAYIVNAGTLGVGTVTVRAANVTANATITPGTITVHAKALRTT